MGSNRSVDVQDLGLIEYQKAWDYQEELFQKVVSAKQANRSNSEKEPTPKLHWKVALGLVIFLVTSSCILLTNLTDAMIGAMWPYPVLIFLIGIFCWRPKEEDLWV